MISEKCAEVAQDDSHSSVGPALARRLNLPTASLAQACCSTSETSRTGWPWRSPWDCCASWLSVAPAVAASSHLDYVYYYCCCCCYYYYYYYYYSYYYDYHYLCLGVCVCVCVWGMSKDAGRAGSGEDGLLQQQQQTQQQRSSSGLQQQQQQQQPPPAADKKQQQ